MAQQLRLGLRAMTLADQLREPSRYLAVGAVCALLNNVILIGGDSIGLHYSLSILLTFVIVLPASYLAHAWWTFRTPANWSAFARFLGGSLSSLVVASFAVWLFRGFLDLPMLVAAPLATVAMVLYNYAMAKWAVARRSLPASWRHQS